MVCDQVTYGRYLSINRLDDPFSSYMILCEVMVMGRELGETMSLIRGSEIRT